MKVAVACDHGGFALKATVIEAVRASGHGPALAIELMQTFLAARYTGEPRHARRLAKLTALEREGGARHE